MIFFCGKEKGAGAAIRNFGSGSRRLFNFGSSALGSGFTTLVNRDPQSRCQDPLPVESWRIYFELTEKLFTRRYFERTHLVRCPARLAQEGKPTELIRLRFFVLKPKICSVLFYSWYRTYSMYHMCFADLITQNIKLALFTQNI
jgi:hypothetical protein